MSNFFWKSWANSEVSKEPFFFFQADFYTFEAGDVLDSTDQGDIDEALEQVINNLDGIFIYNIAAIGLANQRGSDFVNTRYYKDNGGSRTRLMVLEAMER